MNWKQVCARGLELPEVSEGSWFRTPALAVRGKSFVRLKEDGASVVFLTGNLDEQDALLAGRPDVYFITEPLATKQPPTSRKRRG